MRVQIDLKISAVLPVARAVIARPCCIDLGDPDDHPHQGRPPRTRRQLNTTKRLQSPGPAMWSRMDETTDSGSGPSALASLCALSTREN
jgi:hypothetical protein